MERILILTPFRNEEQSIPQYLKVLRNVRWPKDLIDVYWVENDSSDNTLNLLKKASHEMPFKSTRLRTIKILGAVEKQKPGAYRKDIGYGERRVRSWLVIWNRCFLKFVRKSDADYVMTWWADAVPPPNVITEYLKVFKKHSDAGWVGGKMYRRFPKNDVVLSPWPESLFNSKNIVKCKMTGHCWMMPRKPLAKCTFARIGRDMHMSLALCLKKQGLYTYYQPSVYIKHISTDGKIYS